MKHTLKYLIIFLFFSCSKEKQIVSVPSISSFTLKEFQGRVVGIKDNQITVSFPYGALIKNLTAKIETQNTVEIIPKSGIPQDFSKPVYYTLVGENGTKVIYTVKVILEPQPMPIISLIENDTTEAGLKNIINGKYFGNFAYGVKASLINSQSESEDLPFKLLDSTKIEFLVPISTKVGNYKIKVKINTLEVVSTTTLHVGYPSPQIESLSHKNILSSDTLWIGGKFLAEDYKFSAIFKSPIESFSKPIIIRKTDNLGIIPNNLVGLYEVYLNNISEKKLSKDSTFKINVLDDKKPFVSAISTPKDSYKKGDTIFFKTTNFDKSFARFYQVSLKSTQKTYIQNGLFSNGKLSIILPENIEKGNYRVAFTLSDPQIAYIYSFETDLVIKL